jgi:hypothetical protein
MNGYSVLLLYPGNDHTYFAYPTAPSPQEAAALAKKWAAEDSGGEYDEDDFKLLMVTAGRIDLLLTIYDD